MDGFRDYLGAYFKLGTRKWPEAETLHKYKQAEGCLKNVLVIAQISVVFYDIIKCIKNN